MKVFIVRPFGKKSDIDFDRVERELIGPALEQVGASGGTTGEILEAGNIRTDMFQLLLLADLVVADVSVDNANVFYELGVRHALRPRRTVLIRAKGMPTIPFNLRTDRYLEYDPIEPGSALPTLVRMLRATAASERVDSPIFSVLPDLEEPNRSKMMPVPREFREDVDRAGSQRDVGRLGLLGAEVEGFSWESEGFRIVARTLFRLRAFEAARQLWERVRSVDGNDVEANLQLGTVFQRLGDLASSDHAMRRVLDNPAARQADRAEAFALLGRNDKTRLSDLWRSLEISERQRSGLRSRYLTSSFENYRKGYLAELGHFYSGLNALAMVSVLIALIEKQPDVWSERFDSDDEAIAKKADLQKRKDELTAAVGLSLTAARERAQASAERDIWLEISVADHLLLSGARAPRVARAYQSALEGTASLYMEAARSQLLWYQSVGIFEGAVAESLLMFPPVAEAQSAMTAKLPTLQRAIVFTGHMVDSPNRKTPRFPQSMVEVARQAIESELRRLAQHEPECCIGFAGAASGGDILFHEVCAELGIPSRVRLTVPPGLYLANSVAPADADWTERFHRVWERLRDTAAVLGPDERLPAWLQSKADYNIWGRTNLWLLQEALASGAAEVHLIALWNGAGGDGVGGTEHLVRLADREGVSTHILDTRQLFGLPA